MLSSKKDREQKLLLFLSKENGFKTSKELAEILGISRKTIYRIIKDINEDSSNGDLVISEKGRGYKLDYEKYINQIEPYNNEISNFSPDERRNRVMEELLLSSPKAKNVSELYEEYYVGDTVIFNDEQMISEKLKQYNLELVRKHRTLLIRGKEPDIRKAITERIKELNIINVDELRNNDSLNFNNYDVLYILDQLKLMEKRLNITIPYPYDVNIFSHLYILVSRLRRVDLHQLSDREGSTEKDHKDENDSSLYRIAESTIFNIENYLNTQLPENEVNYLYQYLVSSRMGSSSTITTFSSQVTDITDYYLREMGLRLKIKIQSESIFLDLANHIKPMINRLNHGIRVNNSLLDQIKMTYDILYQEVTAVSEMVSTCYKLPYINDDENGFLTLYFARIIETNQLPIRTIIMCTTGVGTSELLRVKIARKFPELDIIDVISTRSLKEMTSKYPGTELILTTINLKEEISTPSLLVSAMLTEDDRTRLQKKIKEIYYER